MDNKPFLTRKEVADLYGVSESTIYRWVCDGKFPQGRPAPGGRRWTWETLEKFIEGGQASSKEIKLINEIRGAS